MHNRFKTLVAILCFTSIVFACSSLARSGVSGWHLTLEIDNPADHSEALVSQTVKVIENRLDAFGVVNAQVKTQGAPTSGRILVSLPDVPDRERLKRIIINEGRLELTAVVSQPNPTSVQTYATQEAADAFLRQNVLGKRRVLPYVEHGVTTASGKAGSARSQPKEWVIVEESAIVDGSDLRNAVAVEGYSGSQSYVISFSLGREGADKFSAWTGGHINEYLGVVLNGEVKSIAFIKSQITDQGEISGRFTKESAEDLALILRSGALPAPVKIVEEGANK